MSSHSWAVIEPVGYKSGQIVDSVAQGLGTDCPVKQPPPPPEQQTPRQAKLMRFTPLYPGPPVGELWYFGVRGRAESLRMIMHYAGMPYDMRTVATAEWGTAVAEPE